MFVPTLAAKAQLTVLYLVTVLAVALRPLLQEPGSKEPLAARTWCNLAAIGIGLAWGVASGAWRSPAWLVAWALLALLVYHVRRRPGAPLAAAAGVWLAGMLGGSLAWWLFQDGQLVLSPRRALLVVGLAAVGLALYFRPGRQVRGTRAQGLWWVLLGLTFAGLGGYMPAHLHPYHFAPLWHHWSAYMGPAELMREGAIIYRDFPAQYGLGPTTLLALTLGESPWDASQRVFAALNGLYLACLLGIAWRLRSGVRHRDALFLLSLVAAISLWGSYAPSATNPMTYPSSAGARYLPAALMASWLVCARGLAPRLQVVGGHCLWAFGALWSPEALFHVTALWWPVRLLDRGVTLAPWAGLRAWSRGAGELMTVAGGVMVGAVSAFAWRHGGVPDALVYGAFVLYPPAPLAPNLLGALWCLGLVTAISWQAQGLAASSEARRTSTVLLLLAVAGAVTWLGRSHDNNIVSVLPFLVLLLQDASRHPIPPMAKAASGTLLTLPLALLPTFGWHVWASTLTQNTTWRHDPHAVGRHVEAVIQSSAFARLGPAGALAGETWLQTLVRRKERYAVLDPFPCLYPGTVSNAWCAFHPCALYANLPSELRRMFLSRVEKRFGRGGWFLVSREVSEQAWLADLAMAYREVERVQLVGYTARRYVPRRARVAESPPLQRDMNP